MNLHPYDDRLIVRRIKEETSSGGLIIMPEDVKRASLKGTIIEKGPDTITTQIGDTILFARYSGFELPLDGKYKDCLVMNEGDVLAKITEED